MVESKRSSLRRQVEVRICNAPRQPLTESEGSKLSSANKGLLDLPRELRMWKHCDTHMLLDNASTRQLHRQHHNSATLKDHTVLHHFRLQAQTPSFTLPQIGPKYSIFDSLRWSPYSVTRPQHYTSLDFINSKFKHTSHPCITGFQLPYRCLSSQCLNKSRSSSAAARPATWAHTLATARPLSQSSSLSPPHLSNSVLTPQIHCTQLN